MMASVIWFKSTSNLPLRSASSASPRFILLRRLRQSLLLLAAQKTQQLHLHHARVVARLDAEDSLEHDLLGERLLVRLDRQLLGDRAGDEVLEHAAIERADQGDGQGLADR